MSNYALMQYASTLLGVLALGIWMVLWYRKTPPFVLASQPPLRSNVPLAVGMFVAALATGLLRAWADIGEMPITSRQREWFILNFSVTALAVAFWVLLLYCLLMTTREYQRTAKLSEI
jgi:hypothetical protein